MANCELCGSNLNLVGSTHRCVPRPREVGVGSTIEGQRGQASGVVRPEYRTRLQEVQTNDAPKIVTPDTAQMKSEKLLGKPLGTYKYRDADSRRSYMANYMRGYRQRRKGT